MEKLFWSSETVQSFHEYFNRVNGTLKVQFPICTILNYASLFTVTIRFSNRKVGVSLDTNLSTNISYSILISSDTEVGYEAKTYKNLYQTYNHKNDLYPVVAKKFLDLYASIKILNRISETKESKELFTDHNKTRIKSLMSWNTLYRLLVWQKDNLWVSSKRFYKEMDITEASRFSIIFDVESATCDDIKIANIKRVTVYNYDMPSIFNIPIDSHSNITTCIFSEEYIDIIDDKKVSMCMKAVNWFLAWNQSLDIRESLFRLELSFLKMYKYISEAISLEKQKCLVHDLVDNCNTFKFIDEHLLVYHPDKYCSSAVFIVPTRIVKTNSSTLDAKKK